MLRIAVAFGVAIVGRIRWVSGLVSRRICSKRQYSLGLLLYLRYPVLPGTKHHFWTPWDVDDAWQRATMAPLDAHHFWSGSVVCLPFYCNCHFS